jgi:hypothetical protein
MKIPLEEVVVASNDKHDPWPWAGHHFEPPDSTHPQTTFTWIGFLPDAGAPAVQCNACCNSGELHHFQYTGPPVKIPAIPGQCPSNGDNMFQNFRVPDGGMVQPLD